MIPGAVPDTAWSRLALRKACATGAALGICMLADS